jgi:hypothetical protein
VTDRNINATAQSVADMIALGIDGLAGFLRCREIKPEMLGI